jgi:hypothetical protein
LIASLSLDPLPIWLLGVELLYLAVSIDPLLLGEARPLYLSKFLVELLLIIIYEGCEGGGSISLFKEFVV